MSGEAPVVMTEALTKRYGTFTALENLSITLERGHILGFIGPNGAGKTTTIKILVGLARPTSGTARIAGADCVHESRRIKRLVGYMPDTFGAYDNMRVSEYLDFFGAAFGMRRKQRRTRISEVMEMTGSTYMRDRYVDSLSHGMKQRVGIARTLLHDPQVLILDEPANGLDPQARIEMRQILLQLAEMGKTLIVTSHILPELSRICSQVAIITNGRLRAFGPLSTIMEQVQQERTIEVQLTSVAEVPAATAILEKLVESADSVNASEAEAVVRFRTTKKEEDLQAMLRALVDGAVGVSQFRELQTDLEDAFISVTQADPQQSDASSASLEPARGEA